MPIYEYKCNECDNLFEILTTSSKATNKVQCEKCHSENVSKLMSAGSIKLSQGSSLPSAPTMGCSNKSGFT